jgi:succinyl-CoA synthetase beta subunit
MDIEEVAEKHPEKIIKVSVDIATGVQGMHVRNLAFGIGLEADIKQFGKIVEGVYNAVIEKDASQIEINPLVKTKEGNLIALDAKMNFDDNALYRHTDIVELRDTNEEEPLEVEASKYGLSYVKMDGKIGCMVNGAGLAMATMDIIKLYGKEPANFLDVGGGANKEKVTAAFKIILSDPAVSAILVNIFGGIMRCDIIAEGIIAAVKESELKVPLVVRLEGTNVEKGKEILAKSGLAIIAADNLEDAAQKVTKIS